MASRHYGHRGRLGLKGVGGGLQRRAAADSLRSIPHPSPQLLLQLHALRRRFPHPLDDCVAFGLRLVQALSALALRPNAVFVQVIWHVHTAAPFTLLLEQQHGEIVTCDAHPPTLQPLVWWKFILARPVRRDPTFGCPILALGRIFRLARPFAE